MKKILSLLIILTLLILQTHALSVLSTDERSILEIKNNGCNNIQEKDIPTILIPGILASWYSEEGYDESKIKRWIPDPITHAYDTLIYTFQQKGYKIKDVFYKEQFTLSINGSNPKGGLYVFGYDWKKDNKITATMLTQLIGLILKDYELNNKCNIGKVNIVAHSMGGLVARAMLEDMCIEIKNKDGVSFIDGVSIKDPVNGKIQNLLTVPCQNPYSSKTISKNIKVNKLITISTPHRGSPKSLPIWEKGDIEMTDGFTVGFVGVKSQLNVSSDLGLYKLIHGYEKTIPNGIITLGQLLPDIKNSNKYNNSLLYLFKDYPKEAVLSSSSIQKHLVPSENYSQNSFLEELNKTENIEKMFNKIDKKYISYYSSITGNNGLNNIVNYSLKGKMVSEWGNITRLPEETYKHIGQDIYNKYVSDFTDRYYYIDTIEKNQYGLGGDGTVPTNNLRLVPNDSTDGKEFDNDKFKPEEIICYDNKPYGNGEISFYSTNNEYGESNINNYKLQDNESYMYKGLGTVDKYEICSHSLMPTATSVKVVNFFLDKDVVNEREQILTNFGKADYTYKEKDWYFSNRGLTNSDILSRIFDKTKYVKTISSNDINSYLYNSKRLSLDLQTTDALAEYDILSPIDIMITDEQGRRIGIDRDTGMIINEIPGAWTSGRAGESGEREFFLIPVKNGEQINHKIETNSTGDGEYHIVLTSYDDKGNTANSGVTIVGEAKLGFNENYEVLANSTGSNYIDTNISLPLTLEVTKEFKTSDDKLDVRYNVKGQGRENVEKIKYRLENFSAIQGRFPSSREGQTINNTGITQNGEEKIDGILEIALKDAGNYELILELLDKNGKILKTETVKIEKGNIEEETKTTKNILNTMFYNNIDLSLYNSGSGEIFTNYQFKITTDQNKQNINITKPNGEIEKITIDNDFNYKSDKNNGLEILNIDSTSIVYKESIPEIEVEKIYTYSFIQDKIEKVEIIKGKNIQKLFINYNINGNISQISSDNNTVKFIYDDYTGNLINLSDLYDNSIEFNYEKLELSGIKINNELLESDLDFVRLDYRTKFNFKHKNNLQKIKIKLESQKLDKKKKQKLIKSLEKSKEKYLKLAKIDITKKEIEYLVEEIKNILEKLN